MAAEQLTQRRERHQTETRDKRLYVTFSATELAVVQTAAGREHMAPAAWAGRQLMAVAQHTLIPVSADTGDVLRELIRSRAHLQETLTALRAVTAPTVPFPVAFGTAANRPRAALPNATAPVLPETVRVVVEAALSAVRRVDEATVQVMRERRPRS
ncbi:hypothetical protein JI76_00055 [Streptomyces anulatus]|uniref:hypothetical protein n=1 Tax=Streptomyces anulatus TaxID=1892 RepID=UPI0006DBA3BD|nr:hypothetical protein [Streptomyces anulatus]KPL30668.1 hypothetical protein JI76_37755 [Streptomyces anulatus]KPL35426.1 hypothetical protein JI76_00055 [Streptomyces anulatus]